MSEAVRASSGIEIPISSNVADLKKGLEEVRRAAQNPDFIKITPKMTFDERQVARESNKIISQMSREAAQAQARTNLFGPDGGQGGGRNFGRSALPGQGGKADEGILQTVRRVAGAYAFNEGARLAIGTARAVGQMNSDDPSNVDRGRMGLLQAGESVPIFGTSVSTANAGTGVGWGPSNGGWGIGGSSFRYRKSYSETVQQNIDDRQKAQDAAEGARVYARGDLSAQEAEARGDPVAAAKIRNEERVRESKKAVLAGGGSDAVKVVEREKKLAEQRDVLAAEQFAGRLASISGTGQRSTTNRYAMLAQWEGQGLRAMKIRQEGERGAFNDDTGQQLVGKRGAERDEIIKTRSKQARELEAKQTIELTEEVKRRRVEAEYSVQAVQESGLRTQHQNYKADEVAFKASWQAKYDTETDLQKKKEIRAEALAAYGTFQQQQADSKEMTGISLTARRQSADLRGQNMGAAAGVLEMVAQQAIERKSADASDLPGLERTQAHELVAMRNNILRPRGYLTATDPLSEMPGGPGGDEGQQMVEFLSQIQRGIDDLVKIGGGVVLQ